MNYGMTEVVGSMTTATMEWNFRVVVAMAACAMVVAEIVRIIRLMWWRPRKIQMHLQSQGIRGPPYKLFLGNAKEMMRMMQQASSNPMGYFSHDILPRVLSFYHQWTKIYGSTFLLWFGPVGRINIADPQLVQEIFSVRSDDYEKIEANTALKKLEGEGLLNLKGQKWAQHRRIINPAFHMENIKDLTIPAIATSATIMLDKWKNWTESGRNEIEVSEEFQTLSADIIARAAFGCSYEEGKRIFTMQAEQMLFAGEAFRKVILPGSRFLPTKRNLYQWRLDKEIKKSLTELIERREQDSKVGGGSDLLGLLIHAKATSFEKSKKKENRYSPVKVEDIMEECKTFFFAGRQTTSNMLTWTIVLLAIHKEWQQMARKQVLEVCGENVPDKNSVNQLRIVDMIVNESMRLYPPVVAMMRRIKKEVKLGSLRLPPGLELMIPILAIHHDPILWGEDANEFNPARFSNGVSKAAKHPMAFIPFGLGPRTCIGKNFTLMEAKVVLAMILQHFTFEISPSYVHAPTVLLMLHPQHGAQVIFHLLNQS
ncbi:cytochrome P450 734A1 [Cryptomeria japonica]|uniref:cytochrome P450 734A1 n=1 Tax=Cryptomeria japonica TaxID=3369 RepID=UPI0027D9E311|nr:cytochrome P450 734A1 [Cryptomeria japonica]